MNNNENFPGWINSGIKSLIGEGLNRSFANQQMNVGTLFAVNTSGANDIVYLPMNGEGGYKKTQTEWIALAVDVQIIVNLASHQTYTLTAPQIALLLGENNIWADTGDMAVEYIADTKLYIQTLTGHPDEDMIADANIASGKFFMVGNRLFISTAAIENGHAIIPGTNCTETNLADALNTLNA